MREFFTEISSRISLSESCCIDSLNLAMTWIMVGLRKGFSSRHSNAILRLLEGCHVDAERLGHTRELPATAARRREALDVLVPLFLLVLAFLRPEKGNKECTQAKKRDGYAQDHPYSGCLPLPVLETLSAAQQTGLVPRDLKETHRAYARRNDSRQRIVGQIEVNHAPIAGKCVYRCARVNPNRRARMNHRKTRKPLGANSLKLNQPTCTSALSPALISHESKMLSRHNSRDNKASLISKFGISPLRLLAHKTKSERFGKLHISIGIEPLRLLKLRSIFLRFLHKPSSDGTVPEILLSASIIIVRDETGVLEQNQEGTFPVNAFALRSSTSSREQFFNAIGT
nr:hypothetical protein Iba_chr01cCG8370 [Ipomoea batatas]